MTKILKRLNVACQRRLEDAVVICGWVITAKLLKQRGAEVSLFLWIVP